LVVATLKLLVLVEKVLAPLPEIKAGLVYTPPDAQS
jgi:hypothetical protein